MLTKDKTITTKEFWNDVFNGKRMGTKTDASNTVRPSNPFDRFGWVAKYAEGPRVLDIASGHAHSCKRIKHAHPDWVVIASDQAEGAMKVANYEPYQIFSAYSIPFKDKMFDTVIICQAIEYLEYPNIFLKEARRVARYFLCTLPIGEMKAWSQLYIYTEESVRNLLEPYGNIEVFEREGDLLLVKMSFNGI